MIANSAPVVAAEAVLSAQRPSPRSLRQQPPAIGVVTTNGPASAAEAVAELPIAPKSSEIPSFNVSNVSVITTPAARQGNSVPSNPAGVSEPTFAESAVNVPARFLSGPSPTYPPGAARADVEADVPIEILVDASGHVVEARAMSAIGYGLEDAALRAARGFRFSPAFRQGSAVRVRMRWVVQFKLR